MAGSQPIIASDGPSFFERPATRAALNSFNMEPAIYLAPMRGYTDVVFRQTCAQFFDGIDLAVAPFITPMKERRNTAARYKDLIPENNAAMPVIPQILTRHSEEFIHTAGQLYDLGYDAVNWNLGCPFPMVAKKQKGSGMLPYPDRIDRFLETVVPAIPSRLSIKTRIGRNHGEEILDLLPVFNRYPLETIIIHPRTGVQMYEGAPDLAVFKACLENLMPPVVYNGDIRSVADFVALRESFPGVSGWMVGRGVLTDPFLPAAMKGRNRSRVQRIETFRAFHDTLLENYAQVMCGPEHLISRMKGFWSYFALGFENGARILKKIRKTHGIAPYRELTGMFFEDQAASDPV